MPGIDGAPWPLWAGLALLALLLGAGVVRLQRRDREVKLSMHNHDGQARSAPATAPPTAAAARGTVLRPRGAPTLGESRAARVCAGLSTWQAQADEHADVWAAFDQVVRELLADQLGAARVRCYRVEAGCETLQALAHSANNPAPVGPALRDGILGFVATSGKEFCALDPLNGPLVASLAQRADDDWTWVWPVCEGRSTTGVVAVTQVRDPAVLDHDTRQAVGHALSLAWRFCGCLERLRLLRHTDAASGVLTRHDFFTLAGHALADSYRGNEPAVVAVLAIEGLRRLDDAGHWGARDALIERVGPTIMRHVRSDDLVGRFADDRFVVLLRRLDSGLGELIAEKILAVARECLTPAGALADSLRLRIGLAGSGLARPELAALLENAFRQVERARAAGLDMATDLERRRATETGP